MNLIGIDIGSSAIKIIETDEKCNIENKMTFGKMPIKEALNNFLNKNKIDKKSILKIALTGVGAGEVENQINNIPVEKVDEFVAIGDGATFVTKENNALIVSVGTGTSFVRAQNGEYVHIGGTGIGGGTLINLCKKVTGENSFERIIELSEEGNLGNVDLKIKDVTTQEIETLPKDTTACNFGKLNKNASGEDLILGIMNMIAETIGMMAVFAVKNDSTKDIIITGRISTITQIKKALHKIERLHNVKFIIPQKSEYITAIGAIKHII